MSFTILRFTAAAGLGAALMLSCSDIPQNVRPQPSAPAASPSPAPSAAVDPGSFPEVVARVNGSEIKQKDLAARAKAMPSPHPQQKTIAFYREALDDLISAELLFQESQRQGLVPSEAEISRRVNEIRSRFPSQSEFRNTLAQQGLSEERMKEALRKDLAVERFLSKHVLSDVSVSEGDSRRFFEENIDRMKAGDEVLVSHILVKVAEGASSTELKKAREKAEKLRRRAAGGEDFAELARRNSDDPGSADQGGDLSWIGPGATVPAFEEAAYALQPGQISPVVRSPFGFHVIQMRDRRPGRPLSFEDAKDQIARFLHERAVQEQIGAMVEALKAKAQVEIYI